MRKKREVKNKLNEGSLRATFLRAIKSFACAEMWENYFTAKEKNWILFLFSHTQIFSTSSLQLTSSYYLAFTFVRHFFFSTFLWQKLMRFNKLKVFIFSFQKKKCRKNLSPQFFFKMRKTFLFHEKNFFCLTSSLNNNRSLFFSFFCSFLLLYDTQHILF